MATPATVSGTMWGKTRKAIGALVICCFFFPFFGISCDGMDVVTISGADMVGGCKPGGLATEVESGGPGASGKVKAKVENVDVEPLAIGALAVAVIVFGLTWLPTRTALVGALALSLAGIGLLGGLWVQVGGKLEDEIAREKATKSAMRREVTIESGGRPALYAAGLGLAALVAFSGVALRGRTRPGHPPPGHSPPPA